MNSTQSIARPSEAALIDHTNPEDFRELRDFPDYAAARDGTIWSRKSGSWRQLSLTSNGKWGYLKVKVIDFAGVTHTVKAHVLVAAAFLGERPAGMEINHKDGNKKRNGAGNLEYVTRRENILHAVHVLRRGVGRRLNEQTIKARARERRAQRMRRIARGLILLGAPPVLTCTAARAQKLNAQQVLQIREHAARRTMTRRRMAAVFGVSRPTIDRIIAKKKWAHL